METATVSVCTPYTGLMEATPLAGLVEVIICGLVEVIISLAELVSVWTPLAGLVVCTPCTGLVETPPVSVCASRTSVCPALAIFDRFSANTIRNNKTDTITTATLPPEITPAIRPTNSFLLVFPVSISVFVVEAETLFVVGTETLLVMGAETSLVVGTVVCGTVIPTPGSI